MTDIHKTAIVSPRAELSDDVKIGPYSIVEENVKIGAGTIIASSGLIAAGTTLGKRVEVAHGAVIGTKPQDLKFAGEVTKVFIGDETIIREYATVNRGTDDRGETTVGKGCLLMAYSHVAHDCLIGDNVILANSVNLAGHIEIGNCAILGGLLPVHQFVKIGDHAMIGGGYRVPKDICPYALAAGYPLKVVGINVVGLRRRGFSREVVRTIEKIFKLLFFNDLNTSQAVQRIKDELDTSPEQQLILDFIDKSTRGLLK